MLNSIISFSDPECLNAALVGNKAANLARLLQLGYNVPIGGCLSTEVETLFNVPNSDEFRKFLDDLKNFLDILPKPWVIRSSSTAEDATTVSFAGQFKTVLGVMTLPDAIAACQSVIESKYSKWVEIYSKEKEIDESAIRMGIIIQSMIDADFSGIAFSINPKTNENEIVIEAVIGLGDVIVGGEVSPDMITVSPSGTIKSYRIGSKKVMSKWNNNRLISVSVPEEKRNSETLSIVQARMIAMVVKAIEFDMGLPQDIEWAIKNNELFILQTRPVTFVR